MKIKILQRWIDHRADGVSISYWPGTCDVADDVANQLIERGIARPKRHKRRQSGGQTQPQIKE